MQVQMLWRSPLIPLLRLGSVKSPFYWLSTTVSSLNLYLRIIQLSLRDRDNLPNKGQKTRSQSVLCLEVDCIQGVRHGAPRRTRYWNPQDFMWISDFRMIFWISKWVSKFQSAWISGFQKWISGFHLNLYILMNNHKPQFRHTYTCHTVCSLIGVFIYTVELLYNRHHWDPTFWPL